VVKEIDIYTMLENFRELVIKQVLSSLEQNELNIKVEIANLREGIANDSKSSMGDKYETSREMSQQEINRSEQQLAANRQQIFNLRSVQQYQNAKQVTNGSLVNTNLGLFFISISMGEIKVDGQSVFMISQASPLGQLLMRKKQNDVFEMNKREIKILEIR
jgi:transcription elongation GreA/GreB family factor